ncbi:TIGR02391 family protein [Streptomyces sp. NBC_01477]|uniref:TIGR02391 family protein n=1 Tax=Streptomyces sp. NBC_01477 TaxID=2976015 RepID=UPI002E2F5C36|nr:TIGR02391 family protein [Streptomyces sp. NBC_01477]
MTNIAQPGWAIEQLDRFIELTDIVQRQMSRGMAGRHAGDDDEITRQAVITERIFAHLDPEWRSSLEESYDPNRRWTGHRQLALRARTTIVTDAEIRENLGDNAPQISASSLHPWVWNSAKALWLDGHYRHAVATAAIKVNAETQAKTGVKDRSEHDLLVQLFKLDPPKPGHPRLRLQPNDGSRTYVSLQEGVAAFARGCFMAIRNPSAHADDFDDLGEHRALEQLAAFSQLARWIDEAAVEAAL